MAAPGDREWVAEAVRQLELDAERTADTNLHVFPMPRGWGIDLYLKDESLHPTGSLKHRLARSLILYGLCNGGIGPTTTLVDASSGSTAVSEAFFARLLGLPFVAVVPRSTSPDKLSLIAMHGGSVHVVESAAEMSGAASALAASTGGHYLDQFTYAERATDWRGNNNIAESVFEQLRRQRHPVPEWIVVGAGTGGTSATFGRFVRYRRHPTRIAVVDPEGSAYAPSWLANDLTVRTAGSRIEGIGRPTPEPSFIPGVIDRMIEVPDAGSIAAMRLLREVTGIEAGASTGTNLWGSLLLARELRAAGRPGSIVTLICDRGDRYRGTYYDDAWVAERGWDVAARRTELDALLAAPSPTSAG